MAKLLVNNNDHKIAVQPVVAYEEDGTLNVRTFPAMISEVVGSFVFIFLFMLCTDKKTQYSDDKVINCFIISSSYIAARLMGGGQLVSCVDHGTEA